MMQLDNVCLALQAQPLFSPVTLTIKPGEIVTLMGSSGCGKSSLLNLISGFLDPVFQVSGQLLIRGRSIISVPPHQRRVGIMFQDDLLFPHLSVGANLAFGLSPSVKKRQERREIVEQALEQAGLAGFGERNPSTLSGGQRARVALMRTLLSKPDVLLLDEPFSKLDPSLREEMRRFVFSHTIAQNLPVLMVSHDEQDARSAGGAVLYLEK
jgi:putative thiamine transport system ATP-binding protein